VKIFNRRLQQSAIDPNLVFSESSVPQWLRKTQDAPVWNEFFVATEGDSVRGAYALKHEQFFIRGKGVQKVACYHHALSEGIVDKSYASVGVLLIRDALQRQPFLYALGMGGYEQPLARMLKSLGFSLTLLPFFFCVLHPNKFLRQMNALRTARWRAALMDIASYSGTGWLGITAAQAMSGIRPRLDSFAVEEISEFGEWADELWAETKQGVSLAAVRDTTSLRALYPVNDTNLTKLRLKEAEKTIGWAIVGERRTDDKFGTMQVGSILDCWGSPESAAAVVRAAVQVLRKRNYDLIVSNQAHRAWTDAFRRNGFLRGPSNFIFAASRKLTELISPIQENHAWFHLTRADGDGLPRNF